MNMRLYILIIIVIIFTQTLHAQWAIPNQMRATNTLDRISDKDGIGRSDLLYGIPLPPGGVIGNTYLDKKWNSASILLYESEKLIDRYPVKYDIKGDLLEINAKNGTKVLDGKKIKSFVWIDSLRQLPRYFINAHEYKMDGSSLSGFIEVLVDGKMPLFKRTTIAEKEPDYVPAFDVGSRDKKIFKREAFYYAEGNALIKIKSKKVLLTAFGDQSVELDSYIKANRLDIDKQTDLSKLFEYINSKQQP